MKLNFYSVFTKKKENFTCARDKSMLLLLRLTVVCYKCIDDQESH
jgi:hypothetical protein